MTNKVLKMFGFLPIALAMMTGPGLVGAQESSSDTVRVAVVRDMAGFDPQQFVTGNFYLIKNLYDSLIEYTPEGKAVPSLASAWAIADDNLSISLTLREDVLFHSGNQFNAAAVAATLEKATDPERGQNVFSTMSVVKDWTMDGDFQITINFKNPTSDRQMLDLAQFLLPIDPAGMDNVATAPAGTGAYLLEERLVGQSLTLRANPNYWRKGEPATETIVFTVFDDDDSATAALESGIADIIYSGSSRSAIRLGDAGYQIIKGPGKLTQVFRINSTRGPFQNQKFRQAFNFMMDRENILRIAYSGLGDITALPWAAVSPAYDASYIKEFAFDVDKAKALLAETGLSAAEMNDWALLVRSRETDQVIAQIVQASLAAAGLDIKLNVLGAAEWREDLLGGNFAAVVAAVGNVQKFPSRVSTNSIYRTSNNPVFGDPHPHPDYVAAIERVNTTVGSDADVQAAYDTLNRVLVEEAFVIPITTYETGLIVAAPNVSGFTVDIDNMFVARTVVVK
ncbi:MAG: ABC transporter substrate-binding protein [Rhodobacteraceae bacterium]|nr:ABC transporter substrate-binding protein [Paracoccaceae bacterium]